MKKDFFLSFPLLIKWNIISECNLRCKHCFLSSYTGKPSLSKIKYFIEQFHHKNIACISFTGGEPLLRNDLEEIIETATKFNIQTNIATNGTLLNKSRIDKLISCGLKEYQISIDAPIENIHDEIRGPGNFKKSISAISNLKARGATVILAMTLNKLNYKYMQEMVNLCENLDVDSLRFEIFIPMGSGKNSDLDLGDLELNYIKNNIFKCVSEKVKVNFPLLNSKFGCGAGSFNCVINSDFTLSPCDMLIEDIKTTKINTIDEFTYEWKNSNIFLNWRNLTIDDPYCNNCDYLNNCNYGCRASALALTGSLNGGDKLCIYRSE